MILITLSFKRSIPEKCAECRFFRYCPKMKGSNDKNKDKCLLKALKEQKQKTKVQEFFLIGDNKIKNYEM